MKHLLLLALCALPLCAQNSITGQSVFYQSSAPSGSCNGNSYLIYATANNTVYACGSGNTWGAIAGGASSGVNTPTFTGLAKATSSSATLTAAAYGDVVGLFSTCNSSFPLLSYSGACVANSGGGGGVTTPTFTGIAKATTSSNTLSAAAAGVDFAPGYSSAIAAWGDSLTSGNQDAQSDSWPNSLSKDTGRPVFNYGVGGMTSTQIAALFASATPLSYYDTTVIWSGHNNPTPSSTVTTDISGMISALISPARYLVLSITNDEGQPSGSSAYTNIIALNAALASAYPSNYLDIRTLLISQATGSVPDTYDTANGIPPFSLRALLQTSTLNAAITTTSTCAIALKTPYTSNGIISVDSEYIVETAGSGNNVTGCTRGYFGSTAATHANAAAYTVTDPVHFSAAGYAYIGQQVATWVTTNYPGTAAPSYADGVSNVAVGTYALNAGVGYRDIAIGQNALAASANSSDNLAVGVSTLAACTTCTQNTAISSYSLTALTTATQDTMGGVDSGNAMTTGAGNTGFGAFSLALDSTASFNTAFGAFALQNATAADDTAVGYQSCYQATSATNISCLGYQSLASLTSGAGNTAIGYQTGGTVNGGVALVSGSNDTFIGLRANTSASNPSQAVVLGANALGTCSNCVTLGRTYGATEDLSYAAALTGQSVIPTVTNVTGTVAIVTGSTNAAGTLTSSTSGTVKFTLTWGGAITYPHRAVCDFTDETTNTDSIQTTQATVATTTTLTATGTTVTGDVIAYSCLGY